MRVTDLSHPLVDDMQVFPGDPGVSSRLAASIAQDGFQVAELHMGTHSGTHIDAPLHVLGDGKPVDELSLDDLVGPARIVHVPGVDHHDVIAWSDVRDQLADVPPGTIVLFHTGWSRHFGTTRYVEHPVLHVDVARHLVSAGVRVMGVDTLNPDPTLQEAHQDISGLPVHAEILGAGKAIVENLTNLHAVTWEDPVVCTMPLPLHGLDGSPVRAVALQD